ncbi:TPA: hypothetical protein EYP66_13045 [Candidatus Poribacteria bacterium]|nr:hypothetical protein [Candidatus Poribacteria bacterium]
MARHVFFGENEREPLEFLYTHSAEYLMFTHRDIAFLPVISSLGSDENFDRYAKILYFGDVNEKIRTDSGKIIYRYLMADTAKEPVQEILDISGKRYQPGSWQISSIYLQIREKPENTSEIAVLVEIDNGKQVLRVRPQEIYFRGRYIKQEGDVFPCTILVDAHSSDPMDWRIVYLSSKVRQNLMVKLFLLNMESQFFLPVYPDPTCSQASDYSVRIWKIKYPEGLKLNSEYLNKQFPKSDLYRSWMMDED